MDAPYDPHAHTQGMIDITLRPDNDPNSKNPLQYITHAIPNYAFELSQRDIPNGTISPIYPGTNNTPLKARISLVDEQADATRYSSIIDIEKIEFKLRNNLEQTWFNIKGISFDKILFGGRLGNQCTPSYIHTEAGNWDHTGVAPRTYGYNNYDDFYFSDFYTSVHKNDPMDGGHGLFANYPWDSRFLDGNYEYKCAVTSVQEQFPQHWSEGLNFEIDNFWPFIRGVNVFYNGTQVYTADYYSQGCQPPTSSCDKVRFTDATYSFPPLPTFGGPPFRAPMKLHVLASEALLGNLDGKLWDPSGASYSVPQVQSLDGGNGLRWEVVFDNVLLSTDGEYKFEFYGKDKAEHEMLNFDIWDGSGNIETVPHRSSATNWAPSNPANSDGKSREYKFKLNNSCPTHFTDDSPSSSFSPTNSPCDCEPRADTCMAWEMRGTCSGIWKRRM